MAGQLVKALIGKEDCNIATDENYPSTFTRITSVGGAVNLTSFPDIWKTHQSIINAKYYGAHDATRSTLGAAVSAQGTTDQRCIIIDPGTWLITDDLDLSAYPNVFFSMSPGALFQISGTKTLTLPSPANIIAQPNQQIKTGAGTLAFAGKSYGNILAAWFGVVADYNTTTEVVTTDSYAALQAAIDFADLNNGGIIELPPGAIYVGTVLQMADNVSIVGAGSGYDTAGTVIGATSNLFQFTGQSYNAFRDFTVVGKAASSGSVFYFQSGNTVSLHIERVLVQSMVSAMYVEGAAIITCAEVDHCKFIYNTSWHVDIKTGAVINLLHFTDTKFDAQDNVAQAGLFRTVSALGQTVFTRCLFQSSSSQYAVLTGGNAYLTFEEGMFYNNANDSRGIITNGAHVKIGVGNAVVLFDGVQLLGPKSTAVNFYHINANTASWQPKIIIKDSSVVLDAVAGLILADNTYASNISTSNLKFIGTPVATPYDMLANAGSLPKRHNNDKDSSTYHLTEDIVKTLTTTNNVATTIAGGQYIVQPSTHYLVTYEIIGRQTDAAGTVYGAYNGAQLWDCAADRTLTSLGVLYSNQIESDAGLNVYTVAVSSGTTPAGIQIKVTGKTATTMYWVCRARIMAIGTGGYPI